MADFRKWLIAFALVAILLGLSVPASAVTLSAQITCNVTASPKQVRSEGVTEIVGDIVLTCTGGTPTAPGQPIALNNLRVGLGVPLTSRIVGGGNVSEALLLIDEPFPGPSPITAYPPTAPKVPGAPTGQYGCLASGGTGCQIFGVAGVGGNPPQPYDSQNNTFQGITTAVGSTNYIDFLGVPFDPPGTNAQRIIRIANIRGDMTHAGGLPVFATVTISGNGNLTAQVASTQVATPFPGFQAGAVGSSTITQCNGNIGAGAGVTFSEGFASAFLTRNLTTTDELFPTAQPRDDTNTDWVPQNVPGFNYFTESGLEPTLAGGTGPPIIGASTSGGTPAVGAIGAADYGTRFLIKVTNLQQGVTLTFPGTVTHGTLTLYLVSGANADGTGGAWAPTSSQAIVGSAQPGIAVGSTATPTLTGFVVYEVVKDDPTAVETITVAPTVTAVANPGANQAALTAVSGNSEALASVSFAPIAADTPGLPLPAGIPNTTTHGSLPRFVVTQSPSRIILVVPCSCNLLFPWIVNDGQFDTGIAVANTSLDPYSGTHAQSGTVVFNFYGSQNGVTPVPAVVTLPATGAIVVPAGCVYVMVLSQGGIGLDTCANGSTGTSGNASITAAQTQMFTGYAIVQTTFQYCHGVAFINNPSSTAIGTIYEALQLDIPGIPRTGNIGENVGH